MNQKSVSSTQSAPSARWIMICILFAGTLAAWAVPFMRVVPHDYLEFLLPWYGHIVAAGRIGAFAHPFSNYTPPYLYLLAGSTLLPIQPLMAIKLLAAVGSAWTAYAIYRLLSTVGAPYPLEGGLAVLLLPTLTINAPILAQADMFWVAPCLLATAAACRTDTLRMTVWTGVAFAFKAQAIFLAPFVVAMLVNQRAPWWHWVIPALTYLCAVLPAWFIGWPLSDLLTVYVRQAEYVPPNGVRYVSTASNWWALFAYLDYGAAVRTFWIGFAATALACALYLRRFALNLKDKLLAAALSATILPFLLPGMHERFYALAELAIYCLAWTARSPRMMTAALLMQAQLVLAFFGWIIRRPELPIAGGLLVVIVIWLLAGPPLTKTQQAVARMFERQPGGTGGA